MSKFVSAISKDYMRSLVITLISTAIIIPLACVLIFVPLWIVNGTNASIWYLIVPAAVFLLLLYGGAFGALAWTFYRRKRWLDGVFTPLGLEGSTYMLSGRQYQGTVGGREVTARFYRGPTLDLTISTPLQTRLGVAEKTKVGTALAGLFRHEPLPSDDPDLEALSVFALDEDWAHSLLANPEAKALLQQLMLAGESWALITHVNLQPGRFLLRLYRNKNLFRYGVEPEEAQEWLGALMALARIAEELPPPQVTDEESAAEELVRTGRTTYIALAIVALLIGVPTCIMAIVGVVVFVIAIQ